MTQDEPIEAVVARVRALDGEAAERIGGYRWDALRLAREVERLGDTAIAAVKLRDEARAELRLRVFAWEETLARIERLRAVARVTKSGLLRQEDALDALQEGDLGGEA